MHIVKIMFENKTPKKKTDRSGHLAPASLHFGQFSEDKILGKSVFSGSKSIQNTIDNRSGCGGHPEMKKRLNLMI